MPGNNPYTIHYLETVVKKDIKKLSHPVKKLIKSAIENKLLVDPVGFGKPLRYSLAGHRRLRVGDYRVVYRLDGRDILVIAIQHRKAVYQ